MAWDPPQIRELLLEAGAIALGRKRDLRAELKADRSIVTAADREIEALLEHTLADPSAGRYLIGEETVGGRGEEYIRDAFRGECFVVDPIDGTAPYAHGLPVWGISIGRMERGVLTDGAVYLPDMGEMLLSDGGAVLQGVRREGSWQWAPIGATAAAGGVRGASESPTGPPDGGATPDDGHGLVSITQVVAKRGKVLLPNVVVVLGTAVVPLVGLIQGRFVAYLGTVKLWDVAGSVPLLLRKGFSITVRVGDDVRHVTERVEEATYRLDPESDRRWSLRSELLVCRPADEARFRVSFTMGETEEGPILP